MQIRSRRIQGHLQTLFLKSSHSFDHKRPRMNIFCLKLRSSYKKIFSKKYSIWNFKIIRPYRTKAVMLFSYYKIKVHVELYLAKFIFNVYYFTTSVFQLIT